MAQMLPFAIIVIGSSLYLLLNFSTFKPEVELKGKNVVITGASSGIGEELAYQYAKYKANIIITARREKELNKVAEKCRQLGANKVEIVLADMSKVSDRDHLLKETEKHFGKNLDYLILNHAIFPMRLWIGGAENMTFLHQTMDINFVSYIDLSTRAVPLLQKNHGHIGVVSAGCAKFSCPRLAVYSASKAALHGFYSAWRQELRYREIPVSITLCVLGLIDTETAMVQAKNLKINGLISPETMAGSATESAAAIVENVALKRYEMYFPKFITLTSALHTVFGSYIDDFGAKQFLNNN